MMLFKMRILLIYLLLIKEKDLFEFYWVGGFGIDASRFFGMNFKVLYGGSDLSDEGALKAPEWTGRVSLYWMI